MDPDLPLPWKLRSDLHLVAVEGDAWVVKDPLRLRYFRLQAEEMELLKLLDGRATWAELIERLKTKFSRPFSETNLTRFLVSTINNSLLVSTAPGYGDRLSDIAEREQATRWRRRLFSAISIRCSGIDPTSILSVTNRLFGSCFHPVAMTVGFLTALVLAGVVAVELPRIESEMPAIAQLATLANLPYLLAAFVVVKFFHELGHGTACRRFGGECHELGVLFVAFVPLLYCDVSDAWLLRERWKRVVVSAAGVLVELVIAGFAALLWLLSTPGLLHTFFLNIFVVTSVNTLLVNGNPLLRYDGYYVLADALGRPNLGPESRRAAAYFFDRVVLGIARPRVTQTMWGELGLIAFGISSAIYRVAVMVLILWVLAIAIEPYGLDRVPVLLGIMITLSVVASTPATVRSRMSTAREAGFSPVAAVFGTTVLGFSLASLFLVPLPYRVTAPFTVTPGSSTPIYVTEPGRLEMAVPSGTRVEAGDLVATLTNPELESTLARAEGTLAVQQENLRQLVDRRAGDPERSRLIPAARKAVATTEAIVAAIQERRERLSIRAPVSGYVMPKPGRAPTPSMQGEVNPLDPNLQGIWLEPQTLVGWIGSDSDLRIVAAVEETAVPFVSSGAHSELVFASNPLAVVESRVTRIGSKPIDQVAQELLTMGEVALVDTASLRPALTRYHVDLTLISTGESEASVGSVRESLPAPLYSTGTVRVHCPPESLGSRLWRLICHTFAMKTW